ncbi:DNA repair protein RecN [Ghiorsea bivora]|uniref:DNA repair protein RecN n=1 Tax=Ghiorsea bivora TaxID=1485545 RepID=UPI0005720390|nr:DNA repair protein RecN [Ghiorsea bivora]
MIVSLHVRQFALFERIELELNKGMTVFTGETGAGKSILVDALGAVFGARANADWVRHGAEKAEVIAEIDSQDTRLLQLLKEQDIDADDGIIIRRVITAEGRSKAWVNGIPTAAGVLKQIGTICFDLHGQHEHQTLMQPEFQQQIIDARVEPTVKQAVQKAYTQLSEINKRLRDLHGNRDNALEKETWMREESERLLALDIEDGLEDKLETECEAGRNIEQVQQAAATALNLFDEQEVTVRNLLGEIIHQVESIAEHHPSLQEAYALLTQMDALASEVSPYLQEVLDSHVDAISLQQAEDRLADLRAAKRRHDTDENGLLILVNQWQEALSALDTASWDEEALLAQQKTLETAYQEAAKALHQARIQAADKLVQNLRPFLNQLGLKNMQLSASIEPRSDKNTWKTDGWDDIQLLAAANIGEPFKSLADTASGGELSRLVLALKGCGALENEPDTAIFDEVDVGIGGETGWCVGELLRNMGSERQVLVVSHLPQVAACAHHQVAIEKSVKDNRTRTNLTLLTNEQRTSEIARMLGGVNDESLSHAATMLKRGQT